MADRKALAKDIARTKAAAKAAGRTPHQQARAEGGTVKHGVIAQLLGKTPR